MADRTVTYSTELIRNYLGGEIVAPPSKFKALQTTAGLSLLFSTSSAQVFEVIAEKPGTRHGWVRIDLSSEVVSRDFGDRPGAGCPTFAVAQPPGAEVVNLAMVVNDGTSDHLYLSLGNKTADPAWTKDPKWKRYRYDDPKHPRDEVHIVGVHVDEATDGEYVVVDVTREHSSDRKLVYRYYVVPDKAAGYAWHPHDVAVDMEAGTYVGCLGRRDGQAVDGFYTAGQVDGREQFTYQPLYNVFNRERPAHVTRLSLRDGVIPSAIASCRKDTKATDLYAVAAGKLYLFPSGHQQDGDEGVEVIRHPLLASVRALYATMTAADTVVWGLNGDNQVFYTCCPIDRVLDRDAWSVPIPILSGVDHVSPYVDLGNSANTFFANAGGDRLLKFVKSPDTRIWQTRDISVEPSSPVAAANPVDSYTTRVQVNGSDGQPASGVLVTLTASNVIGAHIDHLYYVLGPTPVHVKTNAQGSVTIIEPVKSLAGTRLTVEVDGTPLQINPMDGPVCKATALDTAEKLSDATITCPDGKTKPLVWAGADAHELDAVAELNRRLADAYHGLGSSGELALPGCLATATAWENSIVTDVGDLLAWVGHEIVKGAASGIQLVEDTSLGLWNFVVTIGNQVYHAALNTVEAVTTAMQWLYETIKTAVQDLIDFLSFLFEWEDIKRTQKVFRNFARVYLKHHVAQIPQYREDCRQLFQDFRAAMDSWVGKPDFSGLGDEGRQQVASRSTPTSGASAPGSLFAHHYQGNANRAVFRNPQPKADDNLSLVDSLIEALQNEADVVRVAIERLHDLAGRATSMTVVDVLMQLVDIITGAVLESAQNVMDVVLDVVHRLAETALTAFETPIHIPVLSTILAEIGIEEFSFLDIVSWIAAIPATLAYKVAKQKAPFPDDDNTEALIDAPDLRSLLEPAKRPQTLIELPELPAIVADGVFVVGHGMAGLCSLAAAVVSGAEALGEPGNGWSTPSTVLGVLGGGSGGLANFLVPCEPIDNKIVSQLGTIVTGVRILAKIGLSAKAQEPLTAAFPKLAVFDGRGFGAIVDAVLTFPALAVTIWHFVELGGKPSSGKRSIAIIEETSSVMSYIARITYAVAVNTREPETRAALVGVMAVADVCTGGLQIAEAAVSRTG